MKCKNFYSLVVRVCIVLSISFFYTYALQSVFVKSIILKGDLDKQERAFLKPVLLQYENKSLTFKEIERLKTKMEKLFKKHGEIFVKVMIPPQKIKDGKLVLIIVKAKVGKITVKNNKYYSSSFIKRNLGLKEGDYLDYGKLTESLLLLNELNDLQVKSYLQKGKSFGNTNIMLEVNDSRPFHVSLTYDNLGSSSTSKNRVSADVRYGNLIADGDDFNFHTTYGTKANSTKLYKADYETTPFGKYHTRLNAGYVYANYIVTGTFSVLDIKGDTDIVTLGLTQPLLYDFVNRINAKLDFTRKKTKSYLLGSLSSQDDIKTLTLSAIWKRIKIFTNMNSSFSVSRGWGGDKTMGSRFEEATDFMKYNLGFSYNYYINRKNNLLFVLNSQYSRYRLPLSEMFSIGGVGSVRGFDSSVKLGDSGYTTSLEWFYRFGFKNIFKDMFQIGLFVDEGSAYVKNPIPGEERSLNLVGGGAELFVNVKKRVLLRVGVGYPLHSSYELADDGKIIYAILTAKVW